MKKLTALPSVVIMPDGSEKLLDSFTKEEREEWIKTMCERIAKAISEKYAGRPPAEWNEFIRKLQS